MSKPISQLITELKETAYHTRDWQEKIELTAWRGQLITVIQYLEKCYAKS